MPSSAFVVALVIVPDFAMCAPRFGWQTMNYIEFGVWDPEDAMCSVFERLP